MIVRLTISTIPASRSIATFRTPACFAPMAYLSPKGGRWCGSLLASNRFETRSVLVSPAGLEGLRDALDARARLPAYVMHVERLTTLVGFNVHRGCLAIGARPPATPVASWWQEAAGSRLVVAVERIGNADNLGAVFRNALAFGAGGVLLSPGWLRPALPQVDPGCRWVRRSGFPTPSTGIGPRAFTTCRLPVRASWP